MAAKTWETDFRYPAVQASIHALGDAHHDDHFNYPGSFCIPVGKKPISGWTPGRVSLIAIILGFALLGTGIWICTAYAKQVPDDSKTAILLLGTCCWISGTIVFMLPAKLDRPIICSILGKRGRQLLQRIPTAESIACELSNSNPDEMSMSIDGDDHVLILFDQDNYRLLIEGIGARYQIRAEDVEILTPFEYKNYVGAEIICKIDSQTNFRFGIARVSLLLELTRQLPFLKFLRKNIRNKLLENSIKTLQPTPELDTE